MSGSSLSITIASIRSCCSPDLDEIDADGIDVDDSHPDWEDLPNIGRNWHRGLD